MLKYVLNLYQEVVFAKTTNAYAKKCHQICANVASLPQTKQILVPGIPFFSTYPILTQHSISISPEKVRKPNVFWYFEGVWKWNIVLNWVNPPQWESRHVMNCKFDVSSCCSRAIIAYLGKLLSQQRKFLFSRHGCGPLLRGFLSLIEFFTQNLEKVVFVGKVERRRVSVPTKLMQKHWNGAGQNNFLTKKCSFCGIEP